MSEMKMNSTMQTDKWDAADYSQNSQIQQKLARELIAKLALKGSEAVLDIGCGDGKVTAEIASAVPVGSVLGVDNSRSMIALATQRFPKESHPNLSFQIMDARELEFDRRFDVVFSNAALHWVKDHQPVVAAIFRSLNEGGRILLQFGAKGGIDGYLAIVDELRSLPEWRPYFTDFVFPFGFHGVDEYQTYLSRSGFYTKRVEYIVKDVIHAGKDKFAGWIRTTWVPYVERIPEAKKDDFIDLIATNYIEKYPVDKDGNVHVEMGMLEVEAAKRNALRGT